MKTAEYFTIAVISLLFINCSAAPRAGTENANIAWQNSSEMSPPTTTNANADAPVAENQTAKIAPDALVRDLYKQHDAQKGPFFQTKSRALVDKYFDKNLADTIWKEANEPRDGIGALDADPLYSAQDTDIKNLVVNPPKINGDKAAVVVAFNNYERKEKFTYALVKQSGEWKISDINYGEYTLKSIYKSYYESTSNAETEDGEFAGRYQVGDTTCTVAPAKMSFNVKWAKGAGAETYFFKESDGGRWVFEADAGDGLSHSFAFDDENYDAGTFYRADGKTFPVKRIK